MHDLPAKSQWTGTRTITAAGNRTCIITLRLRDFKSQTSLTLLLRHYELTNENVSYFLTNQSKRKTSIDIKVTRKPKPTKNNTRPYLNEIPTHFIHEIKTKGYDVISVNLFLRTLKIWSLGISLRQIQFSNSSKVVNGLKAMTATDLNLTVCEWCVWNVSALLFGRHNRF